MASKYIDNDDLRDNQRISDFVNEPRRMLISIQDCERKPLVTIEEAGELIVNLLIDEFGSIMLYSMEWESQEECLYHVLNATFRSENRKKLIPWFLFLKLILTAFAHLPTRNRFAHHRIKRDLTKSYTEAEEIICWGFSSCTSNMKVLKNKQFLGTTGTRTLLTIKCISGKDIQNHSV